MKITLSNELREKLTSVHGVTKAEIEECFDNREVDSGLPVNPEQNTFFVARTNRGRPLGITYKLAEKVVHVLQLPDKTVTMEQEGPFFEVVEVDSAGPLCEKVRGIDCTDEPIDSNKAKELVPRSRDFGFSEGQPIDRYYVDQFISRYREDIRGRVLEIADDNYTKRFGKERVTQSDILHIKPVQSATLVGNLENGEGVPVGAFDCIILTQTLPFIYNAKAAIQNCFKALKPGGTLLCTVNGICQISRFDMDRWGDYWRFTDLSLKTLLLEVFPEQLLKLETYGNLQSAKTFLSGVPAQEMQISDLNFHDSDYQVLIAARATKAQTST